VGAFFGVTAGRDVRPEATAVAPVTESSKPAEPTKDRPSGAENAEMAHTTPPTMDLPRSVVASNPAGALQKVARQPAATPEKPSLAAEPVAEPARMPNDAPPTANPTTAPPKNRSAADSTGNKTPKPVAASTESPAPGAKGASATGTDLFDDTR
jgi:hypothetical protein